MFNVSEGAELENICCLVWAQFYALVNRVDENEKKGAEQMKYYIASCVFTAQFPELSRRIREWVQANCELEPE